MKATFMGNLILSKETSKRLRRYCKRVESSQKRINRLIHGKPVFIKGTNTSVRV